MSNSKKRKKKNTAIAAPAKGLSSEKKLFLILAVIALVVVIAVVGMLVFGRRDGCDYAKERDTAGHDITYVEMKVKDFGKITLLLDATTAPITVKNFVDLAESGFYNGLTFHRIMDDFMIQGGDPLGNGSGGNTDANGKEINIKGEFANNGVPNDISHKRGVISMAREGDHYLNGYNGKDTASSQFFICNADSEFLDGDYAAFGYVVDGMSVVDEITSYGIHHTVEDVIQDKSKQPVIEYVKVLDGYR